MNTLAALSVLVVLAVALGHSNAAETADPYDWDYCTEEEPCREDMGDCDRDAECEDDLVCGKNNCNSVLGLDVSTNMDCCRQPQVMDWEWCSSHNKCGHGEGDCDSDDECETGTTCGTNNCLTLGTSTNQYKDCCESIRVDNNDGGSSGSSGGSYGGY